MDMNKIFFHVSKKFLKKNFMIIFWVMLPVILQFNAEAVPKFLTLPLKVNAKVVNGWYYSHPPNEIGEIHKGTDYEASYNQEIVAAADGVAMTSTQYNNGNGFGKFVLIMHNEKDVNEQNYFTLYAHVNSVATGIKVYPTDQKGNTNYSDWTPVKRGDVIAYVGNEDTTWTHLHFEVQIGGYALNKTDPYDLYKVTTTTENSADYYPPSGYLYTSCGPNHLWITDPIFVDVQNRTDWFFNYVHCLSGLKIINGYPDGTFKPGNPVSRSEFIKMVVLAVEKILGHEYPGYCPYPPPWQIDTSKPENIYLLKSFNYTNSNVFPAERMGFWPTNIQVNFLQEITREEAAHIVRNALNLSSYNFSGGTPFTDVSIVNTYASWVLKISEVGILDGYSDKTYKPSQSLNRAEAAKMIKNMLKYKGYFINTNNYPEICNED
ncbi:MAG: S-layer homology domain-containing protein [Acidobacteria bacterium]|jgi:hypothetical protein|nr:S-layer homology domain-containing protein [Acidobacteriota bacterium]